MQNSKIQLFSPLIAISFFISCKPSPSPNNHCSPVLAQATKEEKQIAEQISRQLHLWRIGQKGIDHQAQLSQLQANAIWDQVCFEEEKTLKVLKKFRGCNSNELLRNNRDTAGFNSIMSSDEYYALYLIACLEKGKYAFNRDAEFHYSFSAKYRDPRLDFVYRLKDSNLVKSIEINGNIPPNLPVSELDSVWMAYQMADSLDVSVERGMNEMGFAWYKLSDSYGQLPPAKVRDFSKIQKRLEDEVIESIKRTERIIEGRKLQQ